MKIASEVVIEADRETVWAAFDDADNMKKWQPDLKAFNHKSGPRGEPGSVAELVYDENGREFTLIERMTEKRKPDFMAGTYESKWSKALIVNHFETTDDGHTRWKSYANHNFQGFMKIMAFFVHKSICRRMENDMQRFKLLVESQQANATG
jgi:uncharacterized protein YndB with AHSA1/START domain